MQSIPSNYVPGTCSSTDDARDSQSGICVPCGSNYVNRPTATADRCARRSTTTSVDIELLITIFLPLTILFVCMFFLYYFYIGKKTSDQLVRSETAYTNFVFHEIRNPIHAAMANIDFVFEAWQAQQKPETDEEYTDLANARVSLEHTMDVLRNVLDLSKTVAGKLRIEPLPIRLSEVIGYAARMMHGINRNIVLVRDIVIDDNVILPDSYVNCITEDNLVVKGDAQRLKQILINLIGNSLKFTREGFVLVYARIKKNNVTDVELGSKPYIIEFNVCDSGVGISEEQQANLFTKYHHSDAHSGTGLGLVLSKIFVELMSEGTINVTSPWTRSPHERRITHTYDPITRTEPFGAKFSFEIQTDIFDPEDVDAEESPHIHNIAMLGRTEDIEMQEVNRCIRVLVVDDVSSNRKIMMRKLTRGPFELMNIQCEQAQNGEEALALFHSGEKYDVIILDQLMHLSGGIMTGTETANEIRKYQQPLGEHTVLIACSGCAAAEDIKRFEENGMDLVWLKPVPPANQMFDQLTSVL